MAVPDRFAAVGPLRTGPALRAPEPPPYYAAPPPPEQPEFVDLFRRLWRHRLLVMGCLVACAIAAVVAVRAMPSYYIARSEEHTSELQSIMRSSYAVFCLKKK